MISPAEQADSIRQISRGGMSLLEVILAIAILGGSLAVIFELVRIGMISAMETRVRSEANILCDAKMAEVSAGVLELQNVNAMAVENRPDWLYYVDVQESSELGLLLVTVRVEQAEAAEPVTVSITRFMPDPDYDPAAVEEDG